MAFDYSYDRYAVYRDRQPIILPEGKSHGSSWSATRTDCLCPACDKKRQKLSKRGWKKQWK